MSKQHPYPQHVLHKVAAEIRHSVPTLESWEARALAQSVLTTLWNADQPSTLSSDEARTIWDLAVAAYRDDAGAMNILRVLLVKHAPDWGEPDGG